MKNVQTREGFENLVTELDDVLFTRQNLKRHYDPTTYSATREARYMSAYNSGLVAANQAVKHADRNALDVSYRSHIKQLGMLSGSYFRICLSIYRSYSLAAVSELTRNEIYAYGELYESISRTLYVNYQTKSWEHNSYMEKMIDAAERRGVCSFATYNQDTQSMNEVLDRPSRAVIRTQIALIIERGAYELLRHLGDDWIHSLSDIPGGIVVIVNDSD